MIGAKPVEFRHWDYRTLPGLEGKRIVIHAAARAIKPAEIMDLIARCHDDDGGSLIADKALPLLHRIANAHQCQGVVELAAGLGTAILGTPRDVNALFKKPDSDRIHKHMWGWPLTDVKPFVTPVHARGQQGFWEWPSLAADLRKPERVG